MKRLQLLIITFLLNISINLNAQVIYTWGNNAYGQLGDGTTTQSRNPLSIGLAIDWKQIV